VVEDAQFVAWVVVGAPCLPFWRDARFLAALDPMFRDVSGVEQLSTVYGGNDSNTMPLNREWRESGAVGAR
jgi:hypothetical protein